ncbi:hypothetical protein J5N58_04470 [Rhizobium cremeum]|uniref:hypothetical protein n=1 Tax=Rhizobium cremeum TaxID=2813827 RepID=UPI000DDEC965|nr:hypothetical protein [Rhizobium cremeum]MCJ7993867.1 hypothetical protein [Rhizobium cremeum]MCJ7998924.1 hypothetical protein [Rhizobium cremeum]
MTFTARTLAIFLLFAAERSHRSGLGDPAVNGQDFGMLPQNWSIDHFYFRPCGDFSAVAFTPPVAAIGNP